MAIIGKIRERSGLLLVIVGLAMLSFILGGWDTLFGGTTDELGIGLVYGEKVDQQMYNDEYNKTVLQDRQQAAQAQREYTPRDEQASGDRAWNAIVDKVILKREFDALGITCSDDELNDYLYGRNGFTLLPDIEASFRDSITGKFNARLLEQRIDQMENATDKEQAKAWQDNKQSIREGRMQEKYYQILGMGVYITKLEAKNEYVAQKETKNVSFVMKRYSEIPDDDVKVSDEEVRKYYEEHKNEKKYESQAGRDLKFFDISVIPSKSDSSKFNAQLDKIKAGFASTDNDSTFVLANSDLKMFSSTHLATFKPENDPKAQKGMTYPQYMDTTFKMAAIGDIVGPYDEAGRVRLAKVLDFNTKQLSVRHILIGAPEGNEEKFKEAQFKADTILKKLTKDNFEEYVKYTDDKNSIPNGGKYENFLDYEMVPEFSNFASEQPVGKIGTVRSKFGIHIIEVLDRKAVKYPVLAIIEQRLKPSAETEEELRSKAIELLFSIDEKVQAKKVMKDKIELFDSLASKNGYFSRPIRLNEENLVMNGFITRFAEDRILKLAYDNDSEEGMLCSAPIRDEGKYIIAMLTSIREKGVPDFEDVEERMRFEVIKEKKAAKFKSQMLNVKSLDALSRKLNTTVQKADLTFASPTIVGAGFEPEIVGSVFSGLRDGQITLPLKGEQGVYVIQLIRTTKAPKVANYKEQIDQLKANGRNQVQNGVRMALRKKAEVIDNRRIHAVGILREI